MIKVTIIALGKLKEAYLKDAVYEYQKRLSRYCDLKILEIEPIKLSDKPTDSEIETVLDKEAELILKKIPENNIVTALCVEGKAKSSEELASELKTNCAAARNMTYIIGSSYGMAEKIKNKANSRLSVSAMTFPHQLFRVMLLEQIYRAFKINEGSAYHK